ncbi:HNH endonuclease [Parafrankia discariae]|uniref:HNH endonuclease n=1 Tax=Parafrankia discariae TaxID=365528 RepID=UPI0003A3AB6C|nr:HNH endonuclease [Parafrankia discariae]
MGDLPFGAVLAVFTAAGWLVHGGAALAEGRVTLAGVVLVAVALAPTAGRVDRRIERHRFARTLRAHGYRSHQEYIRGPQWRARRARWLRELGRRPCRVCARPWQAGGGQFHAHHLDYAQAGGGTEPDRDLMPICYRCHTTVHRWDRWLRGAGVTLRAATWIVVGSRWPVRAVRRYWHQQEDRQPEVWP